MHSLRLILLCPFLKKANAVQIILFDFAEVSVFVLSVLGFRFLHSLLVRHRPIANEQRITVHGQNSVQMC